MRMLNSRGSNSIQKLWGSKILNFCSRNPGPSTLFSCPTFSYSPGNPKVIAVMASGMALQRETDYCMKDKARRGNHQVFPVLPLDTHTDIHLLPETRARESRIDLLGDAFLNRLEQNSNVSRDIRVHNHNRMTLIWHLTAGSMNLTEFPLQCRLRSFPQIATCQTQLAFIEPNCLIIIAVSSAYESALQLFGADSCTNTSASIGTSTITNTRRDNF